MSIQATRPMRPVRIGSTEVSVRLRPDGIIDVCPVAGIAPYPARLTDRLHHWAARTPDRPFMAERDAGGGWRTISYAETLANTRRLAQALIERDLSAERPLMVLSGNGIVHALLGLAALYAGIPYCPVPPAYALVSQDFGRLKYAVDLLTPGMVYAADAAAFARAIDAAVPAGIELVVDERPQGARPCTSFGALIATTSTRLVDLAHGSVGPDSIAKFLLTSGATGLPKAVINTQRMLCANQAMLRDRLAFLQDEPPVVLDWLPWSDAFGGNHNLGLVLFNGGTLYIDDGGPTPDGIEATLRNLREIAPTLYFNTAKGFGMLVPHLQADRAMREQFYSRLQLTVFAGAALAPQVQEALDDLALATVGARIPMLTGLGAAETAPFAMSVTAETSRPGHVGLPVPGNDLKLVPVGGKLEARLKGPNVTPGYWRRPYLTAEAFDEDAYFKLGDAVRFVDEADIAKGFAFDGRIADDFKLASGMVVSAGPLRAQLIALCAPLIQDFVLAGPGRDAVVALAFPDLDACRAFCGLPAASLPELAGHQGLRDAIRDRLRGMSGGASARVVRVLLLEAPPAIDLGEITAKGSISQQAVLQQRADLVAALYAESPPPRAITVFEGA